MSAIEKLKAEAASLVAKSRAESQPLKHCNALEQVARRHGYRNWRACLVAQPAGLPPAGFRIPRRPQTPAEIEMKRYFNREWGFSLNIPQYWNTFPAVSSNSPFEVIRLASREHGFHQLIVFRHPCDPAKRPEERVAALQAHLAKSGSFNFLPGETAIGSRHVLTLDFNQPYEDGTWGCRHYSIFDGTLSYRLGFGSTAWNSNVDLCDRMAKSFEFFEE